MTETVHVLVYGSTELGVCDYYRLGMYRDLLATEGVELREWTEPSCWIPPGYAGRPDQAVLDGVATVDMSPVEWADVVLFRRFYATALTCSDCSTASHSDEVMAQHATRAGHAIAPRADYLARPVFDALATRPELLRGRALMYETDDNLLAAKPWTSFYAMVQCERDFIDRMLRRADLVTVTTPMLASMARQYNDRVRVVRNAIDPRWYEGAPVSADLEGDPRILYYGVALRLRDYQTCRAAVDDTARQHPGARRVWLGADHDPNIRAVVDEVLPYVDGVPEFAQSLVAARPDIGVAPVAGDDFDRGHSELHWLEYSMAGAATVASRTMGGGPYDVIRHGVDGLLARNHTQWREALARLAASPALRQELAGRAHERVRAEYDARLRAKEWAGAYLWAAEHGGIGGRGRLHALGGAAAEAHGPAVPVPFDAAAAPPADEAEMKATFRHRLRTRAEADAAPRILAGLRGDREVCWPDEAAHEPLVSVTIATYDRIGLLLERSLPSVLAQTYRNLDVIVVGDGSPPHVVEAMRGVTDPRVRFVNLPERGPRPPHPELAWLMSGSRPFNEGLRLAKGHWIAPQADDDEFTPDHVEVLLSVALEHRLEFVYGESWVELPDDTWVRLGDWPPRHAGFCAGAVLYAARLRFLEYDEECWREREPNDWNLWRRVMEAGVRMGNVEHIVFRHYKEARHRLAAVPAA